ncbi:MAG: DUF6454 family protein [Rickettsiales bacterium]
MKASVVRKLFSLCSHDYALTKINEQKLSFDVGKPQGLVYLDGMFILSSIFTDLDNEVKNKGVLSFFSSEGELAQSVDLGFDDFVHIGGMSINERVVTLPVAKYYKNSQTYIYDVELDPSLNLSILSEKYIPDHIGVSVKVDDKIYGYNWGAKKGYKIHNFSYEIFNNINRHIEYQDCNPINDEYYICLGRKDYNIPEAGPVGIGGLDIISVRDLSVNCTIPIDLWVKPYIPIAKNSFWIDNVDQNIRLYFVPEYNSASLYEYQIDIQGDSIQNTTDLSM